MVLIRASGVLPLMLAAGCGESLFDSNGEPDDDLELTCPAPCLADAAADFDGSPTGRTAVWRYLDDNRDRTWTAMSPSGGGMLGADPANEISSCGERSAAACEDLPGALLMSSAGAAGLADPAIELTAPENQVLQLTLRALVPPGQSDQTLRIYRNSREDVLFSGVAGAGVELSRELTVDALAGDRFLVALTPAGEGAADVAIHLFAKPTGAVFPSACQLAVPFAAATVSGTTVDNLCGNDFTHQNDTAPTAPVLAGGPFAEAGDGVSIAPDSFLDSQVNLDKSGDVTIQLWMRTRRADPFMAGFAFSDMDLDLAGGLSIDVFDETADRPLLEVVTITRVDPREFGNARARWAHDGKWRFVRVVHTGGVVSLCIDGVREGQYDLPAGKAQSSYPAFIGKNVKWSPVGAFYDGDVDDLRVFTGALPCE